jgi:hypothetical protein
LWRAYWNNHEAVIKILEHHDARLFAPNSTPEMRDKLIEEAYENNKEKLSAHSEIRVHLLGEQNKCTLEELKIVSNI